MSYQYTYSDHAFKIISADSGLVLYGKGDIVASGPEIPESQAYLWKLNPENGGVYNVESGLYISAEGKLSASSQAWDLADAGDGNFNIKVKGLDQAVTISGEVLVAAALGAGIGQAFKIVKA